ncbi:hypothetical protein AB0H88_33600 [Nonomuraea sp. NPDC050680]|uniref:hypothetical protein n=1 Tax=Nonomuraea sp. NPDC050680 TaxID=3154630 RepID=UPI00340F0674
MRKILISLGIAVAIVSGSIAAAQADDMDPDCIGVYENGICDMSWTDVGSVNPTPSPTPTMGTGMPLNRG